MSARAVIIVESCFGNTAAIAEAVAASLAHAGVAVEVVDAQDAPAHVTADLILVGAPTHNLALPSSKTRAQATERGARPLQRGVREWIASTGTVEGRVITFATITGRMSGSAAAAAARRLRRRGVKAERGPDFRVDGVDGPLADGERDRAQAWAQHLDPSR